MGVQSTDIYQTDGTPAINYLADDETWTILPGVLAGSQNNHAVFSGHARSTLINDGYIFCGFGSGYAVQFVGADGMITNNAGATIAGLSGLFIAAGTVNNHGSVNGYRFDGVAMISSVLNNDGEIFGKATGVFAAGGNGGVINNSGVISSDGRGIWVNIESPSAISTIDNAAGGIIRGTQAAIFTATPFFGGPGISLNNRGMIDGDINCTADGSNDSVVNRGTIDGDVFLGGGDDFFDGRGGTVTGDVHGGAGNDVFLVNNFSASIIEATGEGTDTVRSFINWTLGANVERLELQGSGNLNGTGNALNNTLVGNSGSNVLNGGAGNDYMVGGAGNDIFIVGSAGDSTIENAGQGTDTVRSYVSWTLGANVERLELQGSSNLNGTGNTLANTLVGNSGANVLSGGAGNDYITGGSGNDTLNGGDGNDTLIGGAGRDILIGGAGNDVFDFNLVSESPAGAALRDSINGGFSHGADRIDLATIDANTLLAGNQAFSFIGSAAFSGVAGQLRYSNYNGTVIIDADVNGDSTADMQILVAGTTFMTGTDFIV